MAASIVFEYHSKQGASMPSMTRKKLIFILALAGHAVFSNLLAMDADSTISESTTSDQTTDATIQTPDASSETPTQDMASMAPAATPTDSSSDASSSTPPTADIQPEQMTGPDILELSEDKPGELVPSGNPQVTNLFEQSNVVTEQSNASSNQLWQRAQQFRDQFHQLQIELDNFYEKAGEQQGRIAKDLEELTQPQSGFSAPVPLTSTPTIAPAPLVPMLPAR